MDIIFSMTNYYLKLISILYQWTPLHVVASKAHDYTVKGLVKKGANVNIRDTNGVGQTMLVNYSRLSLIIWGWMPVLNILTCPCHFHIPWDGTTRYIHNRLYQILMIHLILIYLPFILIFGCSMCLTAQTNNYALLVRSGYAIIKISGLSISLFH